MKKQIIAILAVCIHLTGCAVNEQVSTIPSTESPILLNETVSENTTVTEPNLPLIEEPETTVKLETKAAEEKETQKQPGETSKQKKTPKTESKPTEPAPAETAKPTTPPKEDVPEPSAPKPTKPSDEKEGPPETEATQPREETEPTKPKKPAPTEPETAPTEPEPTEPTECSHDWVCIHHDEEGHWKAGVVCDCGWSVYGDASELVSKWNAHSASYPPDEALINHGGYGGADKWIVDTPAYDEWVCRHCAEPKP